MYQLIINPVAGNSKAEKHIDEIKEIFQKRNVDYTIHITEYPKHATEIAKKLVEKGEKYIVAVGGDGTVSEVAMGIYGSDTALGIIPAGTGNDYRRALGIPDKLDDAIDFLLKGKPQPADVMEVNSQKYINIVSMGFDVDVLHRTDHYKFLGPIAYKLAAIEGAFFAKTNPAKITIDGKTFEKDILLTAIGCGTHYGGGINALPNTDFANGFIDICQADHLSALGILSLLPKYVAGKHADIKEVHMYSGKEITIELKNQKLPINADGEILEPTNILNVKILEGYIKVIR